MKHHHFALRIKSRRDGEEHIPRPAPDLRMSRVEDFRTIAKLSAVIVCPPRLFVVEVYGRDLKRRKGVQFSSLRETVVVCVLPEAEAGEDSITAVDHAVAVAALRLRVILREGKKAVWVGRRGLRGIVAEEFCAVVNRAVAVSVQHKESVVGVGARPGDTVDDAVVIEVESHAVRIICEVEAVARYVNEDGRAATGVAARTTARFKVEVAAVHEALAGKRRTA